MTMLVQFAWKEYRALRGVWCWTCGLTLLAVTAAWWLASGHTSAVPLHVVWLGAALLGLAATATLVAGERGAGTWKMYDRLPICSTQVWSIKLGAVVLAQALLLAVASALGMLLVGGWGFAPEQWRGVGLCLFEALAWGMLAASLINRPLTAATAAGVAMAALYTALTFVTPVFYPRQGDPSWTWSEFLAAWWALRLAAALAALFASLAVVASPSVRRTIGD
jgi:ABC-type transport system involved in multi-copper enzyme maturation permease subunit